MFSVPAKDWTKQAPTWSSHLPILNLRDWEVEALVANMLPIHDLVDRLLILCAEPKCPLLHGCMSLWCWYLLFVVMIELHCQMYWLSVYLQHIPYQYVQPKEEITLALFADTQRKPFQFAGSLAEGTTILRIPVPLISRVDSFKLFIYIDTHPKQDLSFPLIVVVLSHMEWMCHQYTPGILILQ